MECICEKPVACGDIVRLDAAVGCDECDMPLYLRGGGERRPPRQLSAPAEPLQTDNNAYRYFIKTSSASVPPSEA